MEYLLKIAYWPNLKDGTFEEESDRKFDSFRDALIGLQEWVEEETKRVAKKGEELKFQVPNPEEASEKQELHVVVLKKNTLYCHCDIVRW